jgi:DinB superfamily
VSGLDLTLPSVLIDRFNANAARVRELASSLTDEQFWHKPFPFGNSLGHLVLHLTGNLNYYVGAQIAATGYIRERPLEFTDPNPPSREETLERFDEAVAMVVTTIRDQSLEDWSLPYSGIGTDSPNRLAMVVQCAAHMQHHIGQMIYLAYQCKQKTVV